MLSKWTKSKKKRKGDYACHLQKPEYVGHSMLEDLNLRRLCELRFLNKHKNKKLWHFLRLHSSFFGIFILIGKITLSLLMRLRTSFKNGR